MCLVKCVCTVQVCIVRKFHIVRYRIHQTERSAVWNAPSESCCCKTTNLYKFHPTPIRSEKIVKSRFEPKSNKLHWTRFIPRTRRFLANTDFGRQFNRSIATRFIWWSVAITPLKVNSKYTCLHDKLTWPALLWAIPYLAERVSAVTPSELAENFLECSSCQKKT